jgi:acyl-CoA synthetase (NDP forming)
MRFNLAISPGQELATTAADFMDYALDQPTTRVVGLILETVRDPAAFIAALEKARSKQVPVIVMKLGRTEAGAALAVSHSGAIAGNDAAYDALFSRYGVIRAKDMDEFAATALLLSQGRTIPSGGLAAILDSGGEREMLVDLADDIGVRFSQINEATVAVLEKNLDPGLEPLNPLDAWGTGHEYEAVFENCLKALMDDPDTAIGMFVADLTSGFYLHEGYAEALRAVARRTSKPICAMTNYSGWAHAETAMRLTRAGIPVLDGTSCALLAVRHALEYRDFLARPSFPPPEPVADTVRESWRVRLAPGSETLDEREGLSLLADYGIPVQKSRVINTLEDAVATAEEFGYPVVLKTAATGILHKTEVGGVKLALTDKNAVVDAYMDLAQRLGPRVLVAQMVWGNIEMAFGMINDPMFGPFVLIATGGTWIEVLKDRQVALAPVDPGSARRRIDALRMRKLLDGVRGAPACDIDSLVHAFTRLSVLAADLGDLISEMDVNPVKVGPAGAIAVDALVAPRRHEDSR